MVDPRWDRFGDSEYLRGVLIRICATPDGWCTDPEADDLIRFAAARFTQLAVKHGLSPEDGMGVVFEAMRSPSVRYGQDPWGVIVHAVVTTMRAWQFADETLTSIDTARRGGLSGCRAERFSERDQDGWDRDPALAVDDDLLGDESSEVGLSIPEQAIELAGLFTMWGWPGAATVTAIEIVLRKLADAGSRPTAFEALRRERRWRAITGLPAYSWMGVLRVVLGSPTGSAVSNSGKGVLLRLALDESLEALASDPVLTAMIRQATPQVLGRVA
jgi:hypothetical protein